MKFIKFIVIVLAAAIIFSSCKENGGTIEVTNGTEYNILVTVIKGLDIVDAFKNAEDEGQVINRGQMKSFTFSDNGVYTVVGKTVDISLNLGFLYETVTLLGGMTEKVTLRVKK